MPEEGEDLQEHLMKKYGRDAVARYGRPGNPLDVAGAKVGIIFNPARRVIGTWNTHRAVEWCNAVSPEKANNFMEALFIAYFTEAKNVSKIEEIIDCATKVDLDVIELRRVMSSTDLYRTELEKNVRNARINFHVSAVPHFIIESLSGNGHATRISGAQPSDILAEQLLEAYAS